MPAENYPGQQKTERNKLLLFKTLHFGVLRSKRWQTHLTQDQNYLKHSASNAISTHTASEPQGPHVHFPSPAALKAPHAGLPAPPLPAAKLSLLRGRPGQEVALAGHCEPKQPNFSMKITFQNLPQNSGGCCEICFISNESGRPKKHSNKTTSK